MRKITVLAVGKIKEPWWVEAQEEYLRRLRPYAKLAVIEVTAEATGPTTSAEQSMSREGSRLLDRLPKDAFVIALERTGKALNSIALATVIARESEGGRELAFVIGGAEGLDDAVLSRASAKISLSAMTFTHEMARVFLLEQLYRAEMIEAGKTYHR